MFTGCRRKSRHIVPKDGAVQLDHLRRLEPGFLVQGPSMFCRDDPGQPAGGVFEVGPARGGPALGWAAQARVRGTGLPRLLPEFLAAHVLPQGRTAARPSGPSSRTPLGPRKSGIPGNRSKMPAPGQTRPTRPAAAIQGPCPRWFVHPLMMLRPRIEDGVRTSWTGSRPRRPGAVVHRIGEDRGGGRRSHEPPGWPGSARPSRLNRALGPNACATSLDILIR